MNKTLKLLTSLSLTALVGSSSGIHPAQAALPGKNGAIVFSRDVAKGKSVNHEIVRARRDGTHPDQLTFGKAWDRDPAWSPNGSRIIFVRTSGDTSGLWIMKADGSDKRLLDAARHGSQPAWSPDGKSIVFVKDGVYTLDLTDPNAEAVPVVEGPDEGEATFMDPAWSPDGERIAYALEGDLESYVGVVDADGGNDERWELSYFISGLDWSPSGHRLVTALYDARPGGGDEVVSGWEIYTVDPDVADPAKSVRRITMNGYGEGRNRRGEGEPVWSPNGEKIMFAGTYGGDDKELVTVNADFRKKARPRVLTTNNTDDDTPSWLARP